MCKGEGRYSLITLMVLNMDIEQNKKKDIMGPFLKKDSELLVG
jgi:hypothetical protein